MFVSVGIGSYGPTTEPESVNQMSSKHRTGYWFICNKILRKFYVSKYVTNEASQLYYINIELKGILRQLYFGATHLKYHLLSFSFYNNIFK